MAFMAEFGAERDENQQAKTLWALEFFAQRLQSGAGSGEAVDQKAVPEPAVADGQGVSA